VVVDPCEGTLACGYEGQGKLAPVDEIVARVVSVLVA
jgi:phosphopantothenoylcysteine synthetase/decarboxylase